MWGGLQQAAAFGQRLEHQLEVAILQVAQTAVDEFRRLAGGLTGKVATLTQGHLQAARGRIAGNGSPGGSPAND
jgi:hypothetical protein